MGNTNVLFSLPMNLLQLIEYLSLTETLYRVASLYFIQIQKVP